MSFFGIAHLQEQQLRDDEVGDHVVHGRAQEDDAVHQQPRVNVIAALAAAGLLDHHRHQEIIHKNLMLCCGNLTERYSQVKCRARSAMRTDAPPVASLSGSEVCGLGDARLRRQHLSRSRELFPGGLEIRPGHLEIQSSTLETQSSTLETRSSPSKLSLAPSKFSLAPSKSCLAPRNPV